MVFFKRRPGQQLGQTGGDEGQEDTPIDRPHTPDLIVIETQLLLAIFHVGFKVPSQFIVAHQAFDRQAQIGGVDEKVAIGFAFFGSAAHHRQAHRLRADAAAHQVMGYRQRFFKTGPKSVYLQWVMCMRRP